MSEQDYPPNTGQQNDEAPNPSEEGASAEQEQAGPAAGDTTGDVAELNDRILRLAAELENTRRRAAREKADAGRYAIASFAHDLLGVADNFERALRAADDENAADANEAMSGLIAGLRMTEKELLNIFERYGVRRIFPEGEKFDPNLHQAVAHVPGGRIPAGHVVDVAQPGFTIGDRVLRAAMVTVSSGNTSSDTSEKPGAHFDTKA